MPRLTTTVPTILLLLWLVSNYSAVITIYQFDNNSITKTKTSFQTELNNNTDKNNNKGTTKTATTQECWRHCPVRPNKIYFALDNRQAGIGDRISIINNLAQLAGYLCATLVLPSATSSLATIHNDNERVSEFVRWEDFINLTFIEDSMPVISRDSAVHDLDDYIHVNSTDKGAMRQDFTVVQYISWHQSLEFYSHSPIKDGGSSFVWEIHTDFNNNNLWDKKLQKLAHNVPEYRWFNKPKNRPYLSTYYGVHPRIKKEKRVGCVYTNSGTVGKNDGTPSHLKVLRRRLLGRIYNKSARDPILVFLHLRRGDLTEACDTSVQRLRKLVVCSFKGMKDINRNITLLLGSDERDEGYRHDVMRMVEEELPYVETVDIDKVSWEVAQDAVSGGLIREELLSNYYIFLLQEDLRFKIAGSLDSRRFNSSTIYLRQHAGACKDCFNITNRYKKRFERG